MVHLDIQLKANISKYEANIYFFEADKNRFYLLVLHKANQGILHAKRIKNRSKYSFLRKYFIFLLQSKYFEAK
jgi:hypothetical protein